MTFLNHIPSLIVYLADSTVGKTAIEEAFMPSVAAEELEQLRGLLEQQNSSGIQNREAGANQAPHRREIAAAFERAITLLPSKQRLSAVIAGAGENEPYDLLTRFKRVFLVNMDLSAARRAITSLSEADRKKFYFVTYDLTHGVFEKLARCFAKIRLQNINYLESQTHLSETYREHFIYSDLGPALNANFVSSCCTMSQLTTLSDLACIQRYAQIYPGKRFEDLTEKHTLSRLQDASWQDHWKRLAHWTNPQGVCCFIDTTATTEHVSITASSPDGNVWRQNMLLDSDIDYRERFFVDQGPSQHWQWTTLSKGSLEHRFQTIAFVLRPKKSPNKASPKA